MTLRRAFIGVLAALSACGGGDTPTGQTTVADVTITSPRTSIAVGETVQLTATVRDQSGTVVTGRTVTWTSSNNGTASVGTNGVVTAASAGTTTISATSEGKSASVAITVTPPPSRDFAIVGAQFTQGVQNGTIPIVLSGNAAAVNVLVRASSPTAPPMQIVLRLFNAAGAIVRTDTAVTSVLSVLPSYNSPSVQFLIPAASLQAGMRWQVVRDPRRVVVDDSSSNDVYPASGTLALPTVTVPAMKIRFVPIVLASHNNATGVVTDALIPEYLRTFKSIYPVGPINAHVGLPFTTTAVFGTAPSGGESSFWTQVLSELDLARIADPIEPDANWYGVIVPPSGFNFTAYGGFSYIPSSGTAAGPHTRTSTGVQLNWFSRPTQARDLVAHELGHTFGRSHAPCGAAGSPLDASFPVTGGTLDEPGHDVYSWELGRASAAITIPVSTGDVMGYCYPMWSSTYTYRAVLQFRQPTVLAAVADRVPATRTRVLVVRGSIEAGRGMKLEPTFVLDALPWLPDRPGTYRVEGLSADGRALFSHSFEPAILDHAPNVRHFTLALPVTSELEESLDAIRLMGPSGEVRLARPAGSALSATTRQFGRAVATRDAAGGLSVACPGGATRGVLLLDASTGAVLGTAAASTARASVRPGTAMAVLCSDGIRTTRLNVAAPD